MTRDKKIIFFGTTEFAVESLKKLHLSNNEIVAVICPPDKPAGRGYKIQVCEVKKYALSNNLKIIQPEKLKDDTFLRELKNLNADLFVVVAFRILPKEVWSMPKYGTFNIHASLLPEYRGAAPINWAIINGELKTGVTSFYIDEKIDTGATLLYKECKIGENENAGEVHDRLMLMGANLAYETCDALFNGRIQGKHQKKIINLKKAPKLFKIDCRIDWSKSCLEIHNHIRGLSPYPTAWTKFISADEPKTIKIFKALYTIVNHNKKIAEIEIDKNSLKIYTKDGYITVLIIQVAGKRKMNIQSFLNGIDSNKFKRAS